jgi:peptidoglycan/LPS O-acetylase OafA/YrhL
MAPLFESVSIAGLLAATTLHPKSLFVRPLSFSPLAWLGAISYSLYIWQAFFMAFRSPLALCLFMPAAALASYYFIELPATRLGHRLTGSQVRSNEGFNTRVAFAKP